MYVATALSSCLRYKVAIAEANGQADAVQTLPTADDEHETYPTIEALSQQRQQRKAELAAATEAKATVPLQGDEAAGAQETAGGYEPGSPEELEAEANQEGAFNPETGEINWDCPCLGGMANGPCGEEFKAAFSCFVFSTEEPKGMDCIDKFKYVPFCCRILSWKDWDTNERVGACKTASANTPKSTAPNSSLTRKTM